MPGFQKQTKVDWADFEEEALPCLPDLYRTARWLTRSETESQDLVQETFFQALRSFERYQKGTNIKAWLAKIMYNLNLKRRRKLGQLQLVADTEEQIAETVAFEPSIPQKVTDDDVLNALEKIPTQFKEVIMMADVEDFAYKEIAEILDVPIGTVMSRLHRGRKILRGELTVYAANYGIGRKTV